MTDQTVSLTLDKREVVGKQVKKLRRQGQVPGVIHDHGLDSVYVQAPYLDIYRVYQRAGKHHPVELKVDGKSYLALIKDANFEPRKNQLRHVVFNAVNRNQRVEAEVPVVFVGENEAEKVGLMLLRQIENVHVEALPADLPDELTVDISALKEIGDRLHVSDITVPDKVEMLTEPEHAVAVVEESRAHAAEEAEAAEAEEGAEGEAAEGGEEGAAEGDSSQAKAES